MLHPITDTDGTCSLIYDLERTFVIDVPASFRALVVSALENGEFSEPLKEWLLDEDLLTRQPQRSWAQGSQPTVPGVTDISLDMSGSCNLGCTYCFERDINSRIGPMSEETAKSAVDFAFKKAATAPKVTLHFGSGEPLIRFNLLRSIVDDAGRRARATGQSVAYELTTNATLVTDEIAAFFRDHAFDIRVSCDGPPRVHDAFRPFLGGQNSYDAVEKGLKLLAEYLPDRVTVNSVLAGGTRLSEVWKWAKELGLRHYHVIKVGAYLGSDIGLRNAEILEFREDLQAICDDLFEDLSADRVPIDYQPITKVVRRLMIPQPVTRFCGVAGTYVGVASNGKVYPCFRHLGLQPYELGDIWTGTDEQKRQSFLGREAADVDSRPICQGCWARYLCGGGCYADSTVYGPDKTKPQVQHCPFWRAEIELAIRLYKRLLGADPSYCFSLFGDDPDKTVASLQQTGYSQRQYCS